MRHIKILTVERYSATALWKTQDADLRWIQIIASLLIDGLTPSSTTFSTLCEAVSMKWWRASNKSIRNKFPLSFSCFSTSFVLSFMNLWRADKYAPRVIARGGWAQRCSSIKFISLYGTKCSGDRCIGLRVSLRSLTKYSVEWLIFLFDQLEYTRWGQIFNVTLHDLVLLLLYTQVCQYCLSIHLATLIVSHGSVVKISLGVLVTQRVDILCGLLIHFKWPDIVNSLHCFLFVLDLFS